MGQTRELRRALTSALGGRGKGGSPLLHGNFGWLIGMSLWTAVMGGTLMALSGKKPKELKDFVYPYIGDLRASTPTYWRDIIHLAHSPVGYVTSSLSSEIGRMADIWQNKDFYGNQIYNPDDSYLRQGWDAITHAVPLPFSLSSFQAAKSEGGNAAARAAGFLGFTKAPSYIQKSDAENLATEFMSAHRSVGSRTRQQAERAQVRSAIRNIYRRGGNPAEEIRNAERKGLLSPHDLPILRRQARKSGLEAMIQTLNLTEQLKVYAAATPEEQKQIRLAVRKKLVTNRSRPDNWTPQATKLADQYFHFRPVPARRDLGMPEGYY